MLKNFRSESNQKIWDLFYNQKVNEENKPKTSINQYKPTLLQLEELTEKNFSEITIKDLNDIDQYREGKNMSHVRGFLISCISQGWITVNKDVIAYLIPIEYKKLVELLLK